MSKVVVCGYTRDAIARVFSLPDCVLLHELKCIPEGARLGFCGGQVWAELSSDINNLSTKRIFSKSIYLF